MRKLSEMIAENQKTRLIETEAKNKETEDAKKLDTKVSESYFDLLKEFGVESIADLDESKIEEFEAKLNALLESIQTEPETETTEAEPEKTETVVEAKVNEADIKTKEDFEEYAKTLLKKAHGDKYDEKKAKEVIDGIVADTKEDWGAAIGKLTAGLGESKIEDESSDPVNESGQMRHKITFAMGGTMKFDAFVKLIAKVVMEGDKAAFEEIQGQVDDIDELDS